MIRRSVTILLSAAVAVGAASVPALAGPAQSSVASEHPVAWTPNVLNGTVYAMTRVGDEIVVGGNFDRVASADGHTTVGRSNLFAFQLGTGTISSSFRPSVDGTVRTLAAGPGGSVYVGGDFGRVDGAPHRGVAKLSTSTGRPVAGFSSPGVDSGDVVTMAAVGNSVYLGGSFSGIGGTARPALARISGTSGALDRNFNAGIARQRSGRLRVVKLAASNDGQMIAVAGTFTQVGGASRDQLALVSTSTGQARNWSTDVFDQDCHDGYNTYLRDLDFSPDASYLVVVTTGHSSGPTMICDAAVRLNVAGTGLHRPVWVNRTGGNSLFSVLVTGSAVYVGGHQRWLDNPFGFKNAGPGAAYRPGISAIDPSSGRALAWNPTRARGVGAQSLLAYPAGRGYPGGVLVGSDTDQLGHEYHARVGAFPLS